jgi:hypothetical protein
MTLDLESQLEIEISHAQEMPWKLRSLSPSDKQHEPQKLN